MNSTTVSARQEKAADYLVTASAALIDAILVLGDTPDAEEIRSFLQDLYELERQVRG